jgi:hypothetical protein
VERISRGVQNQRENIEFLSPETIEPQALEQLINTSESPVLAHHLAVMPDCHYGKGSTVGSVIPTTCGIIPAAVGVDIGCGLIAVETTLSASQLPDNLNRIETGIERRFRSARGPKTQRSRQLHKNGLKGWRTELAASTIGLFPAGRNTLERWAPGIILSKCARMNRSKFGWSCIPAHAALAIESQVII